MKADYPLISIIIPAYNREATIFRCIKSVLDQDYNNIEVVVVDDGSTDTTKQIVHDIRAKDCRVSIIEQPNKGPGAARNTGIEHAKGDYIGFVDSDDWVMPNMYSSLLQLLQQYDADISCCNILSHFDDGTTDLRVKDAQDIIVMDTQEALEEIIVHRYFANNVVTKLYKRKIFSNVRFTEGMIYEDAEIMPRIIYSAEKIVYTNKPYYCHYNSKISILRSEFTKKKFDLEKAYSSRLKFYEENSPTYRIAASEQYLEKSISILSMSVDNNQYKREREELANKIITFYRQNKGKIHFSRGIVIRCTILGLGLHIFDLIVKLKEKY